MMTLFQNEEENVSKKYASDGIVESMLGLGLVILGLFYNSLFIILIIIPLILFELLKSKISAPRIGYFKPLFSFNWKSIVAFLIGWIIGKVVHEQGSGYILGVLFFVLFLMSVKYKNFGPGLYLIGMAVFCAVAELVKISYSYVFIAFGIIMIVLGLRRLVMFINKNPIIPNEE